MADVKKSKTPKEFASQLLVVVVVVLCSPLVICSRFPDGWCVRCKYLCSISVSAVLIHILGRCKDLRRSHRAHQAPGPEPG